MTESVLGIDPGESTGWSYWTLTDRHPLQRLEFGLIKQGMAGYIKWMERHLGALHPDLVICERWRAKDGRRFGDPTDPLRIEGALAAATSALGIEVIWQYNDMKPMCSDQVLKDHGLWITGHEPEVDWENGRDVNDSEKHVLAWGKASGHEASIATYWPDIE